MKAFPSMSLVSQDWSTSGNSFNQVIRSPSSWMSLAELCSSGQSGRNSLLQWMLSRVFTLHCSLFPLQLLLNRRINCSVSAGYECLFLCYWTDDVSWVCVIVFCHALFCVSVCLGDGHFFHVKISMNGLMYRTFNFSQVNVSWNFEFLV